MPTPPNFVLEELQRLEEEALLRSLRTVRPAAGMRAVVDGHDCLLMCSNNYLGLSSDPRLIEAAAQALGDLGCSAAASRLIAGNLPTHTALEASLARWHRTERSLVFSSGYLANVGVISGLVGPGDAIFVDRLAHASILDGALLSRARMHRFAHNDAGALARSLASSQARRKLVVTESLFSMDGDTAPLPELARAAKEQGAMLMVDEAHAVGVYGAGGAGLIEHYGLEGEVDLVMGTLGKSLGAAGGYVAGSERLIAYLLNTSRTFIFDTGLAPAAAAAAQVAVGIVQEEPDRRATLWSNLTQLRHALREGGLDLMAGEAQIIPVRLPSRTVALDLSAALLNQGLFVQAIRPPAVPKGTERLRICVSAAHTSEELKWAGSAIIETARGFGVTG